VSRSTRPASHGKGHSEQSRSPRSGGRRSEGSRHSALLRREILRLRRGRRPAGHGSAQDDNTAKHDPGWLRHGGPHTFITRPKQGPGRGVIPGPAALTPAQPRPPALAGTGLLAAGRAGRGRHRQPLHRRRRRRIAAHRRRLRPRAPGRRAPATPQPAPLAPRRRRHRLRGLTARAISPSDG